MKTIITRACALLFSLSLTATAYAQTAAPSLVLPATDKLVIVPCYIQRLTTTTVRLVRKENFSMSEQEQSDKFLRAFSEGMTNDGFKVSLFDGCTNDDDPGGGITVKFVLQTGGTGLIMVQEFLKVPGEKKLVPVAEKTAAQKKIIGIEEVAASLVRETDKAIKEAQSRGEVKTD